MSKKRGGRVHSYDDDDDEGEGEDDTSLGFDNDKGLPDAVAARNPKSPCTSSRILSAFRALILDISSGRDVRAVSICGGLSCQGYCKDGDKITTVSHNSRLKHR